MGNISAKEIAAELTSALVPFVVAADYTEYKSATYIRVNEEVLSVIRFFLVKGGPYIWYGSYPLCQNDIWLGSAPVGGRFPEEDIAITSNEQLDSTKEELKNELPKIIELLEGRQTVSGISGSVPPDAKVFPRLVQAFCLAKLGQEERAVSNAEEFLESGLNVKDARKGAEDLIGHIAKKNLVSYLENNEKQNIKVLGLKKFMRQS